MEKQQMNRRLKSRHIELMALGGTIGTGLFWGLGRPFGKPVQRFYWPT